MKKAISWWRNHDYNTQEYLKKKYNKLVFGSYNEPTVKAEIKYIYSKELIQHE